jgi:hypothetical protein
VLAPDVEELVVSYLKASGLVNVSAEMPPTPPLPFYLINRLDGGDDWVTEYPCVSIHCFDSTRTLASDAGRAMHKIMKNLTAKIPILMSDGSYVNVDYVYVVESPTWRPYEDKTIWRYCGRYHIDLRLNQTT